MVKDTSGDQGIGDGGSSRHVVTPPASGDETTVTKEDGCFVTAMGYVTEAET